MRKSLSPEVLIDVSASMFKLSGITLRESGNHLIQIRAEKDVDDFTLTNCVLQNSYEQMIKVSGGPGNLLLNTLKVLGRNTILVKSMRTGHTTGQQSKIIFFVILPVQVITSRNMQYIYGITLTTIPLKAIL